MMIRGTRAQRAATLYNYLAKGPDFGKSCTPEQYRLWVSTWIMNDLKDLVPELKHVPSRVCSSSHIPPIPIPKRRFSFLLR